MIELTAPPQEEMPVHHIINVLFIIYILYLDSMDATYHYVLNNVTIKMISPGQLFTASPSSITDKAVSS